MPINAGRLQAHLGVSAPSALALPREADFSAFPWFALHTRSNFEKTTAAVLQARGYEAFLPTYTQERCWSDRRVEVTAPLFPGYLFCRFDPHCRLPIVTAPGVASIVGFGNQPTAIAETEIEAIQRVVQHGIAARPSLNVLAGQRIRVRRGALKGLEGFLLRKKSSWRLVISIELLRRSVAIEINEDWVEPVQSLSN